MERTEAIFNNFLKVNGLSMTDQRRAVFAAFHGAEGHVSAEEIYEIVKEAGFGVGIANVWRTLRLIQKAGLAEEHYFGNIGVRYEMKKAPESHGHIVCQECGRAEEFDLAKILPLIGDIAAQYKYRVDGYELALFGLCHSCQNIKGEAVRGNHEEIRNA